MNKIFPSLLLSTVILTGCGGGGGDEPAQNKLPVVSVAGATVYETEIVTLNALASDADGSITQYRWQQTAGNTAALSNTSSASVSFTAPAVTANQNLTFQVTVTDDQGATASATAVVTVKFNQAPVITVNDVEVDEETATTLSSTISDTDGSVKTINWRQLDGTPVTIAGADSATISFVTPTVEQNTTLRFELTATDNLDKISRATVNVLVVDVNQSPLVSASDITIFETELASITAVASDADGSISKYLWQQVSGTAVVLNNTDMATMSFTAPAVSSDEDLGFKVTVTDDRGKTATASVKATIKFNQAPQITLDNTQVAEQTAASLVATVVDNDGAINSLSWQQTAGPSVVLSGETTSTLSFTTPDVQMDTELQFTVTAIDNLGKSSSAISTVTVETTDVAYSIHGVVTDAPIANAVVSTEVDGVTYTSTANANGEYVLDVRFEVDTMDDLVLLTATSPNNSAVKLHSILGSVEDIRSATGDDNTLTSAELFDANITNVTAAKYALLLDANGGEAPTTKIQWLQATLNLDGDLLIPFAAAVKLVLDYSADNAALALPSQYTNIAELLAVKTAVLDYIQQAKINSKASYDEAIAAILADEKLVDKQTTAEQLVGRYFVDHKLSSRGVAQITLNDDFTGEWLERSVGGSFNWSKTEDGIVLTFGEQGLLLNNDRIAEFQYAPTSTYLQSVKLTIASKDALSIQYSANRTEISIVGEGWDYAPVFNTVIENFKAFKQNAVTDAFTALELNTDYALPYVGRKSTFQSHGYINATTELSVAKLRLSGDENSGGTAYFETADYALPNELLLDDASYPWQLNDDGQIIISLSDNDYVEISVLATRFSTDHPVVSVRSVIGENKAAINFSAAAKSGQVWSSSTAQGIYVLPVDPLEPKTLFWVELNADNTALTVSTHDANNDGELSGSEIIQMPGFWQIDADGDLHVRRYRSNDSFGYCQASQWQPALEDSCQLYNDRSMQLYKLGNANVAGEQDLSIVIDHRFYDSYLRGGASGNPQDATDQLASGSYYNLLWKKVTQRPLTLQ